MVTRAADPNDPLAGLLRARQARVLAAPAIEIVAAPAGPLDAALHRASDGAYDWVILTSRAGVSAVAGRLTALGLGLEALRTRIAAVGAGTAGALEALGRAPDLVPPTFTTAALGRALPPGTGTVLLARADIAPPILESLIEAKGWSTDRVEAYRTRLSRSLPDEAGRALRDRGVDAITFTSASTVHGFVRMAGGDIDGTVENGRPRVACIGPVTAEAARQANLRVDAVARPHTIEGLVSCLERLFSSRAGR
jgi:uroporphyrinogen-III synthase